jgi:hypothetical protein
MVSYDNKQFINVMSSYGWRKEGIYLNKPNFKPIKWTSYDTYEYNGQRYFTGTNDPWPNPEYGMSLVKDDGYSFQWERLYSLTELMGTTPPSGSDTTSALQNLITTSQNTVVGAINSTTSGITNTLNSVNNALATAISNTRTSISSSIDTSTKSVTTRIADSTKAVSDAITSTTSNILNKIQTNINAIDQVTTTVSGNIFSSANNVINNITNGLNLTKSSLVQSLTQSAEDVKRNLDSSISKSTSSINGQIQTVNNGIATSTQNINKNTNDAIGGLISGVTDSLNPLTVLAGILGADYQQFVGSFIPDIGGDIGKSLQRIQNAINKLLNNEYKSWDEFVSDLGVFEANSGLIQGAFNISLIIPILLNMFHNAGQIYSQNITKLLMEEVRPTSLQTPDILKAFMRRTITEDKTHEMLGKLGFDDDLIRLLKSNSKIMLDVNEIKNMYLRGMIDETLHDTKLEKLGFRDEDIASLKQLYFPVPVPQDLIRFAVREVFTPETVKQYGMDQDFPSDFALYGKQVGLDEKWSKAYWAAHWELPSPTMGFEMFHRNIIDEAGLKNLLKSLDVMPYWRDKLIQLSYNPITRVDVRRLYKLGVISLADVEKRYLAIGYSPNDAHLLAKFTEMDNGADEETTAIEIKQLSKSVIEQGYKKKVISREQAFQALTNLGYIHTDIEIILSIADLSVETDKVKDITKEQSDKAHKYVLDAYKRRSISTDDAREQLLDLGFSSADIDIELSFADYEYQTSVKVSIVNKVQDLFVSNTIDDVELTTFLSVNGFSIKEIEQILAELYVYKGLRDRKPTKADFDKFLKAGVITTEEYAYELQGMGYADKYIQMYMISIGAIDLEEE